MTKDADTLRRIADEMRHYTKNWADAEELERIAERIEKMERKSRSRLFGLIGVKGDGQ
jgi:hypothetical protein